MNIKLPPEQERWLAARVAKGEFDSPEAAVQQIIAERMAFEADDPARAEHDAAAPHGDVLSVEDAIADIDAHIASLER